MLFHHFDEFLAEYKSRLEWEHGFFRQFVKEVVERSLDCGNPKCGFACIRCPDCKEERLSFLESEGQVGYKYDRDAAERETMDYLVFIARVTSHIPVKGQVMVRKVYEVNPMICPRCGGRMEAVAFLTKHAVIDRIIDRLKLRFVPERPPPPKIAFQELLMAADPPVAYFF